MADIDAPIAKSEGFPVQPVTLSTKLSPNRLSKLLTRPLNVLCYHYIISPYKLSIGREANYFKTRRATFNLTVHVESQDSPEY